MMVVTSDAKTISEFRTEIVQEIRKQSHRYVTQLPFSKLQGEVNKGKSIALHQLAQFIEDIVITEEHISNV